MLFWTTLKVALRSLVANKLRSLLSMLGIIIGVGAVIAMMAVGAGAQKKVLDDVTALGTDLLVVAPGQGMRMGVRSGAVETLTLEDAQALLSGIPAAKMVTPLVRGNAQFKYFNNNKQATIYGTGVTYFDIRNRQIEKGRAFTVNEVDRWARVAVLGSTTAEELFLTEDPIGKPVKLNGVQYTVVGVLKEKGSFGPFNEDDLAVVPFTTAMHRILGVDYLEEIDMKIEHGADQTEVQTQIETLMRKRHKIRSADNDDFHVRNMAEMVETASSMTKTFTLLLASVAAISLVVGGIGIMNIMLVTVTERTREIGIRKAIGARDRDVLIQFLLEAILMSTLGGLVGAGLGFSLAQMVTMLSSLKAIVELSSVMLALSFAVAVGIFFGFYPARRAASLDPIEALSYE